MRPKEVVHSWVEAFNRADADALASMYADDAINHQVAESPIEGREAIREMFMREFARAEMVCIPENLFEDGEWAILEWRDPQGLRGCGFFRIVGDRIVFQRGYWDKLSFCDCTACRYRPSEVNCGSRSGRVVADSSNQSNALRFAVLAWFCLAAIVVYLQRASIGVIEQTIRDEFEVSKTEMATVMSGYYWAYALGQLPAGWLAQRFGTRLMLPLCIALSSLCCGAMMWARSLDELRWAWTLAGLAVAGVFPCCVQSIVRWFPRDQRAFPSGSLGSSMSIGGAISTALTGWLVLQSFSSQLQGWRLVFAAYAIPGLVWAFVFPLWFREKKADVPVTNGAATPDPDRGVDWWTDYRTWLICAQQFLRAAGYVFYATWFPTFLKETRGVTTEQAGWLTSLPLLGVVLGGALGGLVIDAIDRRTRNRRISRQLVAVVCHALCGVLVFAAAPIDDAKLAVSVISLGSFAFAIGGACSYTITMDLGGSRAAMLFAVMNTCGNVGAAACPEVVAWLLKSVSWDAILYYFSGLYLGVAACWALLDPTPRDVVKSQI